MNPVSRYTFAAICVICASYLLATATGGAGYGWFIFLALIAALA